MYDLFNKIEDNSPLARKFNDILFDLSTVRMVFAPSTFSDLKQVDGSKLYMFYESCLWESYMRGVVYKLNQWKSVLDEYLVEFGGNWKYWAYTKRIECINDFGGVDDDYKDGVLITENVPINRLKPFSVISYLVEDDLRDIVQDTNISDLRNLINAIKVQSELSFKKLFKEGMGVDIDMYKKVDGEMVKMGFADEVIDKIEKEDEADLNVKVIISVCFHMRRILSELRELDFKEDNINILAKTRDDVYNILEFNFSDTDISTKAPF